MQIEHLVEMANQIADYFRAEPDRKEAVSSVALHLRRYWDPRMRKQIIAHHQATGAGLNDIARAAIGELTTLA
jgi:formate dehydrogenase subunit delta